MLRGVIIRMAFRTSLLNISLVVLKRRKKSLDWNSTFLNEKYFLFHCRQFLLRRLLTSFPHLPAFIVGFMPDILDCWSHKMFSVLAWMKEEMGSPKNKDLTGRFKI